MSPAKATDRNVIGGVRTSGKYVQERTRERQPAASVERVGVLHAPPFGRTSTRRFRASDAALAAAGLVVVFVGSHVAASSQERAHLHVAAYVLLTLVAATILLRHRATRLFLLLATAISGIYLALGYPYGPAMLVVALAAGTVAAHEPPRRARAFLALCAVVLVGAAFIGEYDGGDGNWFSALVQLGWVLVPGTIGTLSRSARQSRVQAQAETARRADEQSRLRLAREVHDVVGHDLSVISLQAGVALHVLDREPDQVRAALEAIRRTSTDALDELRATLAMTRGDALDARRDTGAGLGRLPGIVDGLELCGLHVRTEATGSGTLSPAADLVAFRIVQESLTNVLRHSGANRADVLLAYGQRTLTITVTDPGPIRVAPQGLPGRGLVGLAERVAEIRGVLTAEPYEDGWRVLAELPLDRDSANPGPPDVSPP